MRLRLSVQRHRLPPINILWSVPADSSSQAYTVARLLEDINHVVPLEAEHWGLEDYAVEVGGFECLHFAPVAQSLKDDDLVCIRPLLTAEVRARTLCGRYQISEGGQHLVDGIPFGRPYLRTPNRPSIRIPPRKRQRLIEGPEDEPVEEISLVKVHSTPSAPSNMNGTVSETSQKNVRFSGQSGEDLDMEDSEDDEDEDFAPGDQSDLSMDDSDSDSDSSSEGLRSSDSALSDSDTSSGSSSSSSSESAGDPDSDDGNSTGPEVVSSKGLAINQGLPGVGSKLTRSRNKRRKANMKLQKLKDQGILDTTARLTDLRAWQEQSEGAKKDQLAKSPNFDGSSKKRKRGQDETKSNDDRDAELEKRKRELIAKLSTPQSTQIRQDVHAEEAPVPSPSPATSATKRLKPNVSAISRILTRQTRPLIKQSPKAKALLTEVADASLDPELWKSRINVSAFECWEEEYTLSAPPFPFKQHWDPASKLMREKATQEKERRGKKKAGKRPSQEIVAEPDEEDDNIELDYGDAQEGESKPEPDVAEAIESQLLQDVATAAKADLPPLPDDVNSLPALNPDDIKVGAIIAFKVCELNMKTMEPEFSKFKTAIVEEEGDSGSGTGMIGLKIAERDQVRREKKFDAHGNRVYDRVDNFRLENSEDEEEDDGLIHHQFHELLEAKLLRVAES